VKSLIFVAANFRWVMKYFNVVGT